MASKPHGKAIPLKAGHDDVKFKKYTRLTVGQLKYACNFTKHVIAETEIAFTCPPLPPIGIIDWLITAHFELPSFIMWVIIIFEVWFMCAAQLYLM